MTAGEPIRVLLAEDDSEVRAALGDLIDDAETLRLVAGELVRSVEAERVVVEITEHAAVDDYEEILDELRAVGVRNAQNRLLQQV